MVLADVLKRWRTQLLGETEAQLLTGTDEHGMKVGRILQLGSLLTLVDPADRYRCGDRYAVLLRHELQDLQSRLFGDTRGYLVNAGRILQKLPIWTTTILFGRRSLRIKMLFSTSGYASYAAGLDQHLRRSGNASTPGLYLHRETRGMVLCQR